MGGFEAQFNGKRIDLNCIKNSLGKGAFDNNEKLKLIFNFFDLDKSGSLEGKEVASFVNKIQSFQNADGNSIFSIKEQEEFISEQDNKGNSLKKMGVETRDLLEFLNLISTNLFSNQVNNIPHKYAIALDFLSDIVKEADITMENHKNQAGILSDIVNLKNEIFNSELARSTAKSNLSHAKSDIQALISSNRTGSFEKEFKSRRHVDFNKDKVEDCIDKANTFAGVKASYEMIKFVKKELAKTCNTSRDNNALWDRSKACDPILKALNICGAKSDADIEKVLNQISKTKLGGVELVINGGKICRFTAKGNLTDVTLEQLNTIAKELSNMMDKAFLFSLGEKYDEKMSDENIDKLAENTFQKYQKEYEDSFSDAFGGEDAKLLADRYIEKEQTGVANLEMGLNLLNMAIMFVPGGAIAKAPGWLIKGLKAAKTAGMAAAVSHPLDLLEKVTSNGLSKDELNEWLAKDAESAVFMAVGIGASSSAIKLANSCKAKRLVKILANGKNTDEVISLITKNSGKFPAEIVKNIKNAEMLAKALQISSEAAIDITGTIALDFLLHGEDISSFEIAQSLASAIAGGVLHKAVKPLSTGQKAHISKALTDMGIPKDKINEIINALDIELNKKVKPTDKADSDVKLQKGGKKEKQKNAGPAKVDPSENTLYTKNLNEVEISADKNTKFSIKDKINKKIQNIKSYREKKSEFEKILMTEVQTDVAMKTKQNMLKGINENNIDFALELLKNESITRWDLSKILNKENKQNINAQKEIYDYIKNNFDKNTIGKYHLFDVVGYITKENADFAKILFDNPNFNKTNIRICLENPYPKAQEKIYNLIKDNKNFYAEDVLDILRRIRNDNLEIMTKIITDGEVDSGTIAGLIGADQNHIPLLEKLYNDKDFPKKGILITLMSVKNDKNIEELFNFMYNNPNVPKDLIPAILRNTAFGDLNFAYKLLKDPQIAKESIAGIIGMQSFMKASDRQYDIQKYKSKDYISIIKFFRTEDYRYATSISAIIEKLSLQQLAEFNRYIQTVDMKKIESLAPGVKNFNPIEKFYLLSYHFKNGTTDFKAEDFVLTKDFTEYLSKNFLDAKGLTQVLSIFPNTDRNIGSLPDGWIKGISSDKAISIRRGVEKHIDEFMKNGNLDILENNLTKALGIDVKVRRIGSGL